MSAQTLPLFDANTISLQERIDYLERIVDKKFTDFTISLGYFKSKTLARSHNAMIVLRDTRGKGHVFSLEGDSFPDLVKKVLEQIEKIQ